MVSRRTDATQQSGFCRKHDGHCPSLYNGMIYPCSIWASCAALIAGEGKANVRWDENIEIMGKMVPPLPQDFDGQYEACQFCCPIATL